MGLRKPDGAITWISINSVAILGEDDCPVSVVTSCSDITARRQAEEIFKEAIAALPDGFVIFDREDRLIACNDAYRQIYAASAPAIRRGVSFPDMLRYGLAHGQYPEAGDTELQRGKWLAERVARHRNPSADLVQRIKDGRWLQVRERRTPSGYIVGFRTDVSAIMRETAKLQAVIDNFPGGISFLDADLNIIACNEAFRTLLELPADLFANGLPTLEAIFRANAARGEYGPGDVEEQVAEPAGAGAEKRSRMCSSGSVRTAPCSRSTASRFRAAASSPPTWTSPPATPPSKLRRDSEQQARRKSAMLEVTLAHISQGLSMYDAYGRLMVWNDRFAEIYRLPLRAAEGGRQLQGDREISAADRPAGNRSARLAQAGRRRRDRCRQAQFRRWARRSRSSIGRSRAAAGSRPTRTSASEFARAAELAQQAERLARTNMQFDAALTNMSQGLCDVGQQRQTGAHQQALPGDVRAERAADEAGHAGAGNRRALRPDNSRLRAIDRQELPERHCHRTPTA